MTPRKDIDDSGLVVEDDASRFKESMTPEQQANIYCGDTVPADPIVDRQALTETDKDAIDAMLSPQRPGMPELLLSLEEERRMCAILSPLLF